MARRVPTLASTKELTKLDFLYVGDTPVGAKSDNKRIADVQLVHLFLRNFYSQIAGTRHVFTIIQLNLFFFNTNAENLSFNKNLEAHPVVKASLRELAAELITPKVLVDLLN